MTRRPRTPRGSIGASLTAVRIATWNVNSIRQRAPRLLAWLDEREPDVVCLQETKADNQTFSGLLDSDLAARGYQSYSHGLGQWNGVALLSRVGLDQPQRGFLGEPGFPEPEARCVSAVCGGLRVHSVYVPNGRSVDSDHYRYKLAWLAALRTHLASLAEAVVVAGDLNIAPADLDLFNPEAFRGHTHVTAAERAALDSLIEDGLHDLIREHWPEEPAYSYWDYRAGMFHQNLGMRIDLILGGGPVAERVRAAWVDRSARKGKGASDHAPVIVDLDTAPQGDLGPWVPPPSAQTRAKGQRLPQDA